MKYIMGNKIIIKKKKKILSSFNYDDNKILKI